MQIELGRPGGKQQKYQNQKISLPTGYPGKRYRCFKGITRFWQQYLKMGKERVKYLLNPFFHVQGMADALDIEDSDDEERDDGLLPM